MNIDEFHDRILFLLNKEQTSWATPEEIDNALHLGQIDLFWFYAPLYGKDETAKKACDPFKVKWMITNSNSIAGLITLPDLDPATGKPTYTTFAHLLSGSIVSYDNTINPVTGQPYGTRRWPLEFVNDDEVDDRLMSQLKPVTIDRPIATTEGGGVIQLYPQVPNVGFITYLAMPMAPVYGYEPNGRDPEYDPNTSTQLEWNPSFDVQLISKALVYLGINMDMDKLVQYMAQNQK